MKTIVLMLSVIALATTAQSGQRSSLEKDCRALVGKEEPKGTDGKATWANSTFNASAIALMGAPCWLFSLLGQ
jgi:hypothetical protein